MYAVLVKNDSQSYDILSFLKYPNNDTKDALDTAWNSGTPIVGMVASDHKLTATLGATWNGSVFSGGQISKAVDATEEQLSSFKLYVFLSNNKVVSRIGIKNDNPQAEMYEAAFASDVLVVKVPEHQNVYEGETYNWNGTEFTAA